MFQELKLENPLMIVVEALDAVFDAFGEDGISDHVMSASGLGRQLCLVASWIDQKVCDCLDTFFLRFDYPGHQRLRESRELRVGKRNCEEA